jgi:hypothetical protein
MKHSWFHHVLLLLMFTTVHLTEEHGLTISEPLEGAINFARLLLLILSAHCKNFLMHVAFGVNEADSIPVSKMHMK